MTGPSRPPNTACLAPCWTSALSSTALSGTPFQRALPIAPLPSWPPATRGSKNPRLLPEHWLIATSSTAGSFLISFRDNCSGRSTLALDLEGESIAIELVGDIGQVIADEERAVRRDRAVVEDGEWRFQLRRPAGSAGHWAFL